jgi:hypothetical protein
MNVLSSGAMQNPMENADPLGGQSPSQEDALTE